MNLLQNPLQNPSVKQSLSWFLGISIALIIGYCFYLSLTLYSYFIIGRDEANFLLRSSMAIFSAETFSESLASLFQIHGQHILVGMQLANLLSFLLLGSLDFQFINLMGVLYLVIPALLICIRFKPRDISYYGVLSFIVAGAITFPLALSPAHISCAINTACTGNHYLGLGLSIIALYIFIPPVQQTSRLARVVAAEFFILLAVFSSPAALAIIPLLFMIILFGTEEKKILFFIHGLASLIILFFYFQVADPANFSLGGASTLADKLKIILLYIIFFCTLLGSVFFWPEQPATTAICILLGLGMTVAGLWQIKRCLHEFRQRPDLLFFASGFLLLLGMVALIALGRAGTFGSTRYVFYAAFALLFLLLLWLARVPHSGGKVTLLLLCCLLYYPLQLALNHPYIERIQGEIKHCNQRWYTQGQACGVMMKHTEATELLLEAERQGILRLPR